MQNVKEYSAWFFSNKQLESIGEQLVEADIIYEFEYDYENIYEWIKAKTFDFNIELNFSRKHNNHENAERTDEATEPIFIKVMFEETEPSDDFLDEIAYEISDCLNCSLNLGTIEHLGADNFEYRPTKEISS